MDSTPYTTTDAISNATSSPFTVGASATALVGFWGVTPVVQPASASQAATTVTMVTAIATTVFSAAFTGMWAFSSSTVAKTFQPRINQAKVDIGHLAVELNAIRSALVTAGIIKGGA